mgnify:FL=1
MNLDRILTADSLLAASEERPAGQSEWHVEAVGASTVWPTSYRGGGIVVASMDSGVDVGHPDLAPHYRGGSNSWYDPYGEHAEPHDSDGHGTQALGLAVGGNGSGAGIGIAPDATWIAVRIFDDLGETELSSMHLAFQWLLDPDDDPNTPDAPHIVIGSWGFRDQVDTCVAEFMPDVEALQVAGIAVIFAAGNEGPGASTSLSPANYPGVISVGAVDEGLDIVPGSSRGPSACDQEATFPSLVAPGMSLHTTDLTFGGVFPESYTYSSGTSFSAPLVGGALALLMDAYPGKDVDVLADALFAGADDLGPPGVDPTFGNGLLRVDAAYDELVGEGGCLLLGPDGGACDDHNACSGGDTCVSGLCVGTEPLCGDCLVDDDCLALDDGDLCNGTSVCRKIGETYQCKVDASTVIECPQEGSNPCNESQCVPETGACETVPSDNGTACDGGALPCGVWQCQDGSCVAVDDECTPDTDVVEGGEDTTDVETVSPDETDVSSDASVEADVPGATNGGGSGCSAGGTGNGPVGGVPLLIGFALIWLAVLRSSGSCLVTETHLH